MMRSLFHIGPTLGLVLVLCWARALACRDDLTDIGSQALLAPVVLEATVLGPVHSLGVRQYVTLRVDKVHKGPLKDKTHITLHFFGASATSSRNNNKNRRLSGSSDTRVSCTLQPRAFEQGRRYIVFADVGQSASSDNYTVHSVPALRNKTTSRRVRKILCKGCAFAPSLKGLKKHVRLNEAGPMKLVCHFSGKPPPKIQWFKNGEVLKPTSHIDIVTTKKKSSLTIGKAKPRDSGSYECRATSVIGPPVSMKTKVKVVAKPRTTTTSPPDNSGDKQPCDPHIAKDYCHNGGKCFIIISLSDMMCECASGYKGIRCDSKVVDHVPENQAQRDFSASDAGARMLSLYWGK